MAWLVSYAGAVEISVIGYMVSGAFLSLAYFDLAWTLFAITAMLEREYRQALARPAVPPR